MCVRRGSRFATSVRMRVGSDTGSTLLEVLIAILVLTTGVLSMVHLCSRSIASNVEARRRTVATILATQKVEQLRTIDSLSASAAGGSLAHDEPGFADYIDATGAIVSPARAVYTRRWSIEASTSSPESFVLQVRVLTRGTADPNTLVARSQVATVRTKVIE
jgi:type IV pilus modification protein PilV